MRGLKAIVFMVSFFLSMVQVLAQGVDMSKTFYDKEKGERTAEGLNFAIAEDRRIVRNGQFIEPEGLDKYLGRKFDKMTSVLGEINGAILDMGQRLSRLESSMEKFIKSQRGREVESQRGTESKS